MGIIAVDKFNFQEKLDLAASYESLENYLHAIQIYTALLEKDNTFVEIYLRLINLYERTGRIDKAAKVSEKMISVNAKNDYALLMAAEFYMRNSYWEEASHILNELDAADYPYIYYWLGLCYYNLKEYRLAKYPLEYYLENCEIDDWVAYVRILLAKVEFELGNFEASLEHCKNFEYLDSHNWEINLMFAKNYLELDMLTHASIKIEKAFRRKKRKPEILETAAKIFYRSGEFEKAEKYLNLLMECSDGLSAEVYSMIAGVAKVKKDLIKSRTYYELALKIDPDYQLAVRELEKLTSMKKVE